MSQTTNKMGTTPVFKLIMQMSLPAMFSMMIQAFYNIVDSFFVSMYDPTNAALNAINIAYPLQLLLIAFVVGTGVGVNSLIARKLGEGDNKYAQKVAMTGIVLGIATWAIFLLIGIFGSKGFISLFTDESNTNIINYGVDYISIVLIFSLGSFIQVVIEKSIQATGNMIFPMISHLIGAITNIILDPIFIFGIDGIIPEMGVKGAAIATVIGQWLAMIFLIVAVSVKKFVIKFTFKEFSLSLRVIKEIYIVGLSGIIMQAIGSVLMAGINFIIKIAPSPEHVRTAAQTVYGLYFKIQSFVFMPVFGLNQGVSPIIGFNYGARNRKRMLTALKYALMISFTIMCLGMILFHTFPKEILSIFNAEDEVMTIGVKALRRISLCFLPASVGIILTALFQAVGKGFRSLIMSFLRQMILILPLAYFLSKVSLESMWYAFPIAEIVAMTVAVIFYLDLYKKEFSRLGK